MVKRIGVIGFGAIGQAIASGLQLPSMKGFVIAGVCARPRQIVDARAQLPAKTLITESMDALLDAGVDLFIEAAGQRAVAEHSEAIIRRGHELFVLSIGALADPQLRSRLELAVRLKGGSVAVPAGALAGFDGLRPMGEAGLTSVSYTSTKPPKAWLGTPAEKEFALERLSARTVIFRGNASDAALGFPRNANLAAAVALAGIGFEKTRVELVADPHAVANTGHLVAESPTATLDLRLASRAFGDNPKTSEITAASVLAALGNREATVRFV